MEFYDSLEMNPQNVAEPQDIIAKLMAEREKLIMGHYGDPKSIHKKLDESLLPAHYAISLSGEPTMYPKLPELIKYLKALPATKSIFLVTNGQEPQMLRRLQNEDALPTQIYLSTNAADHDSFMKINKPRYSDSWERWNQSLELLQKIDTRIVLRMTIIRNHNDSEEMVPAFADMIRRANVHFIEIKSYMHIGRSTNRLARSDMLEFEEISHFANQLAKKSKIYSAIDESVASRIVLLQNQQRLISPFISAYAQTS
jgi:tRNA wybutosine-synthesizing protein 1